MHSLVCKALIYYVARKRKVSFFGPVNDKNSPKLSCEHVYRRLYYILLENSMHRSISSLIIIAIAAFVIIGGERDR